MSHASKVLPLSALLLALSGFSHAQSPVIVVSQLSPGADFSDLGEAIFLAQGGETILVLDGEYEVLTPIDVPLTIIADGPVSIDNELLVTGLAAGESVVLRGLDLHGSFGEAGLHIDGCAGPVWVEACTVSGGFAAEDTSGVRVTDSLAVHLVRCDVTGGGGVTGLFTSAPGTAGLSLSQCLVAAWDLTATGGAGGQEQDNGGWGGHGVLLDDGGHLVSSGGVYTGGDAPGGDLDFDFSCGCFVGCFLGGVAGAGIVALPDAECSAALRGVELVAGEGVPHDLASECVGTDGKQLIDSAGQISLLSGAARSLRLNAPVREGETLELSLLGEPGDAALVLAAFEPGYATLAYGTLAVAPQIVAILGALPPSGDLQISLHVPELGPGVEGLLLVAQPLFVPAGGGKLLGSPSATLLLDAQF